MERTKQNRLQTVFGFILSLILTLAFPAIAPSCKLNFFAPFLAMSFYKNSFQGSLGWSAASGLVMDLLSSHSHLGLHALNYVLATSVMYPQKQNFFQEKLSTIPSLTFLFSAISTAIQASLLYIFETGIRVSFTWAATDLIAYPGLDAFYGFMIFTLLPFFMPKQQKREYILKKSGLNG